MKKKPQKDNFLYDDIFPPIIEKQINLEPNERSAFQLLEHFSYMNKKASQNLIEQLKNHIRPCLKKNIPLYLEDLKFLIQ